MTKVGREHVSGRSSRSRPAAATGTFKLQRRTAPTRPGRKSYTTR